MDYELAFNKVFSELKDLKLLVLSLDKKLDNKTKLVSLKSEYLTVKEVSYIIKKDRKTVTNYCKDYPEVRRKKEGRENFIHQNDFMKAFEKGRKTPFNKEIFNKLKQPDSTLIL